MKRILSTLLTLVAAIGLVVLPAATAVHAQCTNATLNGNYAMTWSGFTTKHAPVGNEVPWAGVAVVTFDGAGNFSAGWTTAINGVIYTAQTGAGTYTVNSDCTGSLAFTSGDAVGFTSNLVIIGGGVEVFSLTTQPGNTMSFDLKKQ